LKIALAGPVGTIAAAVDAAMPGEATISH
jgi:hypothetical protein